jgi:hypothetical protein
MARWDRSGPGDGTPPTSPAAGRRPTASPSSTWSAASGEFDTTNKNWYLPPIEWENHYRRPRPQPSGCDSILLGEATPTPRRCGPAPRPAPPTAGPMRSPAPRRPGGCGCAGWRRPDRPWFPGGPAPAATSGRRCRTAYGQRPGRSRNMRLVASVRARKRSASVRLAKVLDSSRPVWGWRYRARQRPGPRFSIWAMLALPRAGGADEAPHRWEGCEHGVSAPSTPSQGRCRLGPTGRCPFRTREGRDRPNGARIRPNFCRVASRRAWSAARPA